MSETTQTAPTGSERDLASGSRRHPAIVILDFGSQYSELIARRVRETEVFSLVMGYTTSAAELKALKPKGIILSGGPAPSTRRGPPPATPASGTWASRCWGSATACS